MSALGRAAVAYAERGWFVFPLKPRDKVPIEKGGFHNASCDPATVRAWWRRWPNANIGLHPGSSGFVVLDLDGPQGEETAIANGATDAATLEVMTGRAGGGRHLYFRHPGGHVPNGQLGPELDVRGDAGYVLVPPSVHPTGAVYAWKGRAEDVQPLPPDALAELQLMGAGGGPMPRADAAPRHSARDIPTLELIAEGGRNQELSRYAGRLFAKGHPEAEVRGLVSALNAQRCRPPLPESEVTALVSSMAQTHARKQAAPADVERSILRPLELDSIRASDVVATPVRWLWPGYLPLGKLVMFDGVPGRGKTTVSLDWIARITTGRHMPNGGPVVGPRDVLFITCEDGEADTLKPRLEAAGADTTRVRFAHGPRLPTGEVDTFTLGEHTGALSRLVEKVGAAFVVIDPITAALGPQTNSYKDADVRRVLAPLASMAERTGATVLCIRHPTKSVTTTALMAGGGSIAFAAAARVVLQLADDPEEPIAGRILAVAKNNLGPPAPSIRLSIGSSVVTTTTGEASAPLVTWGGVSELSADDLNAQRAEQAGGEEPREVEGWLRDVLADGAMLSREVLRLGRDAGYSDRTVQRARKRLGVVPKQAGLGKEKHSTWALPQPPEPASAPIFANLATLSHIGTDGKDGKDGPAEPSATSAGEALGDDMGEAA